MRRATNLVLLALVAAVAAAFNELKGASYLGCVLLEDPYIIPDRFRSSGYSGIAMDYLAQLQSNLAFEMRYTPWNDSWSQFIEHMSQCDPAPDAPRNKCVCDIGIGSFTVTNERVNKVNFIWPFSNEDHRMVSRKSDLRLNESQETWFVFKTFSWQVWLTIMAGIVLHAVGTVFFGPFHAPGSRSTDTHLWYDSFSFTSLIWKLKRLPAAIMCAYAHLLGNPLGERRQGTPSFHKTAWLVLGITTGLFLLTIYEASLTVLLFESTKESPFRTLRDFTDCALSPQRVVMIRGGASQSFWNNAVNTSEIWEKCGHGPVGMTVSNLEEGFRFVEDNKADYFFSLGGGVLFRAHRSCDTFAPVGEPFFSTAVAFVLPKQANETMLEIMSTETRILREEDEYASASLLAARNSCDAVVEAKITFGKLWAFFVLYIVSWASLLAFRFVFLWRRREQHLPPKERTDTSLDSCDSHVIVMDARAKSAHSLALQQSKGAFEDFSSGNMPSIAPKLSIHGRRNLEAMLPRVSSREISGVTSSDIAGLDAHDAYSPPTSRLQEWN